MIYDKETGFFHAIAPATIKLVQQIGKEVTIIQNKGMVGDYSTKVDVDTENLIVAQLATYFPGDLVLAEEGYSDTSIPKGRIWLIDPICGTNNLGKGIKTYCTNIALVENGDVVASCVIDHGQGDYFWSVGEGKVYVNNALAIAPSEALGQKIDIDFGSVRSVSTSLRQKHYALLQKLIEETDYDLISLNSSLGFAYTAVGKTDGFVNMFNHPWDIAAASFLITQAGGRISAVDGSPWTLASAGAIAGRTIKIHDHLLSLYNSGPA